MSHGGSEKLCVGLTASVDPFFPAPPKRIFSNVEGTPNMAATVAKMTGIQRRDMIPKT